MTRQTPRLLSLLAALGLAALDLTIGAAAPARAAEAPPATGANMALVMNSADASISVINVTTEKEVRRIPVLREPHHVAETPDHKEVVIGDSSGNQLLFISRQTGQITRRVTVADPYQIGYSPDGRWLTINGLRINQVEIYDAATMKLVHRIPLRTMPSHLAYSPDSRMVYVSLQGTNSAAAIDIATGKVLWDHPVGPTPAGVVWHDGKVLVACMGANFVSVVDPANGRVERRLVVGKGAHNMFYSPDRRILYVTDRVNGEITALDNASLKILHTYTIPGGPDDLDFGPHGEIWVTRRWAERVAVLNPATGAYKTIDVGRSPHGIWVDTLHR